MAGDMLKPWASVIQGPDFPPGYHWTYQSYEYESDCRKENAYHLAMKYGVQKQPAVQARPVAAQPEAEGQPAAEPSPAPEDQSAGEEQPATLVQSVTQKPPAAPNRPATTMGCVYIGAKNFYILKLRNLRNEAVLCIAKEKQFRDYRVVLLGRPMETEDYRCD